MSRGPWGLHPVGHRGGQLPLSRAARPGGQDVLCHAHLTPLESPGTEKSVPLVVGSLGHICETLKDYWASCLTSCLQSSGSHGLVASWKHRGC